MKRILILSIAFLFFTTFSFGKEKELQTDKYYRLRMDLERQLVKNEDGNITTESLDNGLHPIVISNFSEITEDKLIEAGVPYVFKIRAIYKGADRNAKRIILQNINNCNYKNNSDFLLSLSNQISSVLTAGDFTEAVSKIFPKDSNSIATFYVYALRIDDVTKQSAYFIRWVRDITPCPLKNDNFILTSGLSFISSNSVSAPSTQSAITSLIFGNSGDDAYFDPLSYSYVDMMVARGAMDKKKVSDPMTLASVQIKYSSEVLFIGQSGKILTFSTDDSIFTEYMNFIGRASSIAKGQKVRIYYTISKDPLEKWEVQAIEKL